MTKTPAHPFGKDPVAEVALPRAPLAKVIAQLRFPEIASVTNPTFVGPFQEALRSAYPDAESDSTIELTADAPVRSVQLPYVSMWRFSDIPRRWIVALTPEFVALETTAYTTRDDFLKRWGDVIRAFSETIRTSIFARLGVRYINRVDKSEDVDAAPQLCNETLLPLARFAGPAKGVKLTQSFVQGEFETEGATLRVRSAILPPNQLIELGTLPPVDRASWVLDLDMFSLHSPPETFTVNAVADRSKRFAEAIYRVFRWAVTEEFMRRMGASRGK